MFGFPRHINCILWLFKQMLKMRDKAPLTFLYNRPLKTSYNMNNTDPADVLSVRSCYFGQLCLYLNL